MYRYGRMSMSALPPERLLPLVNVNQVNNSIVSKSFLLQSSAEQYTHYVYIYIFMTSHIIYYTWKM
jgi:hypothetical protein